MITSLIDRSIKGITILTQTRLKSILIGAELIKRKGLRAKLEGSI
jgi:hypothetical protein